VWHQLLEHCKQCNEPVARQLATAQLQATPAEVRLLEQLQRLEAHEAQTAALQHIPMHTQAAYQALERTRSWQS
jgi:hypothetical protein